MDLQSVTVIIPALNEERSLPLVLRDLPRVGRVIVVDNGSTDQTAELARCSGAFVVHERQRGYGSACLKGLATIRELAGPNQAIPAVVVFLDGDYSDDPRQLMDLVRPIFDRQADFVLGSRMQGQREPGAMPPQSVFGNWFACLLMRGLFGIRYTDLGPFRAIAYDRLCELGMTDQNFGWTIEMQIKAARHKLRVLEIPVSYRRRIGQSKISGTVWGSVRAGWKILYLIGRYGVFRK